MTDNHTVIPDAAMELAKKPGVVAQNDSRTGMLRDSDEAQRDRRERQ
jgi:hypothetical protein